MDDLFDLDQIRDKWTAKDQGIGLEADPDKTSVNRFALARTHLQTLRQTIELEIPAQRDIFQLFRAPLTNEGEPEEATEFADPPDGDALREELQAILKRVSDLVEIYLVYPRVQHHL